LIIFILWRVWLKQKFGISPSESVKDIDLLSKYPFEQWFFEIQKTLHELFVERNSPYFSYLFCALTLYIWTTKLSIKIMVRNIKSTKNIFFWISAGFFSLACLYSMFGHIVTAHYGGYFKAINIFYFIIPLLLVNLDFKISRRATAFLCILTIAPTLGVVDKSLSYPPRAFFYGKYYSNNNEIPKMQNCVSDFNFETQVVSVQKFNAMEWLPQFIYGETLWTAVIKVSNKNDFPVHPVSGRGQFVVSEIRNSDGAVLPLLNSNESALLKYNFSTKYNIYPQDLEITVRQIDCP
jgi:hypothetical protein